VQVSAIDFWFEFASTYSYLAAARIRGIAQAAGVSVRWQPFLLGPIFAAQGWNDSPFNVYPVKGRYMWRDMERLCEGYGLPFRRPSVFPRNGLLAARVACAGHDAPWLPYFVEAVYIANFARDADISDPALLAGILDALGVAGEKTVADAGLPEVKQRLRDQTDRARSLGIFGAPSFVVGTELFWGNDRLGDAIAWARLGGASSQHRAAAREPG
jgi:2-hydroxychromene-2-carboxylate isomerase